MRVISLKRTCGACPSQWDGVVQLPDGATRKLYARFRWGDLSVHVYDEPDAEKSVAFGEYLFGEPVLEWQTSREAEERFRLIDEGKEQDAYAAFGGPDGYMSDDQLIVILRENGFDVLESLVVSA